MFVYVISKIDFELIYYVSLIMVKAELKVNLCMFGYVDVYLYNQFLQKWNQMVVVAKIEFSWIKF